MPFWTSYLVKTFAWMLILGRNGVVNSILTGTHVVGQPLSLINNEFGVMVGMVHAMVPLAVMTMLPVMAGIDRRLVQAAQTLGAAPARAFWLVYFKLSLPGVAAAGLLVFISSLGFFIVPAFLGGRQETMLAQLIITQVQELLNWPFAGALSAMMLAAALVSCVIYDRLFGLSSIAGGSAQVSTGRVRDLGLAILSAVATSASAASALARAVLGKRICARVCCPHSAGSSSVSRAADAARHPDRLHLLAVPAIPAAGLWPELVRDLFQFSTLDPGDDQVLRGRIHDGGLRDSDRRFCGAGARQQPHALGRTDLRLLLAPMVVPRIVIAVGLFYLFARIGLIATDLGLVIGHTVLAIPFTLVTIAAVLKSYDQRLDQAAATLGANRFRTLTGVTIPLIKGGLVAAFLFAFITSFDELTIAIFVSGGIKTTLPKQMWDDMILQLNPTLAAVSVVVFVVVTSMLLLAERFRSST